MKKILFAIAIVMMLGATANAQHGRDALFSYDNIDRGTAMSDPNDNGFALPGGPMGGSGDQSAPLGSGLLVLTALGAGYAVARKKRS